MLVKAMPGYAMVSASKQLQGAKWAWICMDKNGVDWEHILLPEHFLPLQVADLGIESQDLATIEYPIFDVVHAHTLISFLKEVRDKVDFLVVNCAAGVCRSGAVATFAAELFGIKEEVFRLDNKHISPNIYILNLLRQEGGQL